MTVDPEDYRYVVDLVRDRSAIALDDGKEYLVQARLAPIARREGMASLSALVTALRRGDQRLQEQVVDAMATKETSFFRDGHPFDAMRDVVLPSLRAEGRRRLRIWSAAAATGQEAYSVAMLLRESFPDIDATILATDLSVEALGVARAGRYTGAEVNRGLPARLLLRYFRRDGLDWQLDDGIRGMVEFRRVNLATPLPSLPVMDVVLLRNVLIYFAPRDKAAVLDRIARTMRPGAFLLLGGAETTYGIDQRFERVSAGRSLWYRLTAGSTDRGAT